MATMKTTVVRGWILCGRLSEPCTFSWLNSQGWWMKRKVRIIAPLRRVKGMRANPNMDLAFPARWKEHHLVGPKDCEGASGFVGISPAFWSLLCWDHCDQDAAAVDAGVRRVLAVDIFSG